MEQLPNEIFLELFPYLNARDLFYAFYNLNYRFNTLIKSFHNLNLVFHMEHFINNQINLNDHFPPYVSTLIVERAINVNLNRFLNIRCLKLVCPLKRVLTQLNSNILPHLKHLSISHLGLFEIINEWTSLPTLETLTISFITSVSYETILSACPNLIYFKLSMFGSDCLKSDIKPHMNLKRMIIDIVDMNWPWNDKIFDNCLSCVPNLENLVVHRSILISEVNESLLEYDWLISKVQLYLLFIRRFDFYFKVIQTQSTIEPTIQSILHQIEEKFTNNHNNPYKSCHLLYAYE